MNQLVLRPALAEDFAFCRRLYFEEMDWIIARLGLDETRQAESFVRQWAAPEVRIIAIAGEAVGWLQTVPSDDAIFLSQLFIDRRRQRRGIGKVVIKLVTEEALRDGKAVALDVVKINPARRLYERLGFEIVGEEEHKFHMRWTPEARPA
jgi:GNAT superfamily N-acetyltransferase